MATVRRGADAAAPAAAPRGQGELRLLKTGAAALKEHLHSCADAEQPLVLLWTSVKAEKACSAAVRALNKARSCHLGEHYSLL